MNSKFFTVLVFNLLLTSAMADEWEVDVYPDSAVAAKTGEITNGDRQRFVFSETDCNLVQHIFSFYTEQEADFNQLKGQVLSIKLNGEVVGTEVVTAMKAMSGHLLMFNLGTYYSNEHLDFLQKSDKISIRFIDGNGINAAQYFDEPYNE